MPSANHDRMIAAPFDRVWAFVRDMDNWAPLVTGYQRHEKLSDTESFWFLKGELGGLTRIAEFKVHIDEWDETGRVRFSLQGVNEPVTGSGSFVAEPVAGDAPEVPPVQRGFLARLSDALVRRLFEQCRIGFALTLNAGGGAGMILNMLLTPMMKPVAEDLADRIAGTIEGKE
jgi:carbon monoxide dehydrogenase subunit G